MGRTRGTIGFPASHTGKPPEVRSVERHDHSYFGMVMLALVSRIPMSLGAPGTMPQQSLEALLLSWLEVVVAWTRLKVAVGRSWIPDAFRS